MNQKIFLTWDDIYKRLRDLPEGKLYGIPRGGAIVAALSQRAVDTPEEADVIVDDIIDTGKTAARYEHAYKKPVWALINKLNGEADGWVVFPWEETDPHKDLEDTVIRQLEWIGEDPTRNGLLETPKRVIKAFGEMTAGYRDDPALILSKVFDVA